MDSLNRVIEAYEDNPTRCRVTPKEVERRKNLVIELEQDLNTIENSIKIKRKPVAPVINFRREAGHGENKDTRNLSDRELLD
jgi:hypothetical protein